jgi:membrane protein required for colicin V production
MSDYSLNITDVAVAALIAISVLIGIIRGFVKEVLSIASWALALVAAGVAYKPSLPFWEGAVGDGVLAHIIAFSSVFVGVLATALIITARISRKVESGPLGGMDRAFGAGFGAVRAVTIICLAFLLFLGLRPGDKPHENLPAWLSKAETLPYIKKITVAVIDKLPKGARKKLPTIEEKPEEKKTPEEPPVVKKLQETKLMLNVIVL